MRGFLMILAFLPQVIMADGIEVKKEKCGTVEHINYLKSKNPLYEQQMLADEILLINKLNSNSANLNSNVVYTIPVVVHVVYRTASENISNAQIHAQIDVLNQDFGRTNPDSVNTPAAFRPIASATSFQFCLAQKDPSGAPTTGIERRQTTVTSFQINDDMKFYSTGGLDAWDVDKYLNIWVCNLSGGILGYGELPSSTHTDTYGVVVQYDAFGKGGVATFPYHLGRTCTHEISHCFRLFHIWGDDNGSCTGSDNVADTPNQSDATFGCYTWPKTDNCATSSPGIMYMNYMDYSDDLCLNMFTANQATRMLASINSYYVTLLTSDGCESSTSSIGKISTFDVSIYPNPTSGIVTLDMFNTFGIGSKMNVLVTDVIGRVIYEEEIGNPSGAIHHIDLSNNESGIYLVKLYNDDYSKTEKITLNN